MSRFLGLTLSSILACVLGNAATLKQLTLDQMAQSATSIVRARVSGSAASLTGSTIYTHYKLQVTETWKGQAASEVMIPGGTAGSLKQSFPGMPELKTGTEYVLFLWTSPLTGITHLVGLTQGIFDVRDPGDGNTHVSRAAVTDNMFDAAGRPVKDHAINMRLADMKSRVAARTVAGASQ